jgi:hypothetical protein
VGQEVVHRSEGHGFSVRRCELKRQADPRSGLVAAPCGRIVPEAGSILSTPGDGAKRAINR